MSSKINQKLGLRAPGVRPMMKLPADRAARARLTSARCPKCSATGAIASKSRLNHFVCTWCLHTWEPPVGE